MTSASVTFGLGMLTAQLPAFDDRTFTDVYAELIELCVLAEDVGFDSVWLSEHHFVDDGYMPSLLVVAAAIAARTSRIRIGTGVLVAPLHEPLRIAEDAATVDLLSRGRLLLGLGAGYRGEEFAGFDRSTESLGAALDRCLDTLDAAWSGVPTAVAGGRTVRVTPSPHRRGGPPIWIGARTPAGIRRAGSRADGLLSARVSAAEFAEQVRRYADAAAAAGRDPSELTVGIHCPVFVADAGAWERVEPFLHYSEWKYRDMVGDPYGTRTHPTSLPELDDSVRDRLRASQPLVGRPDEVAARIGEYVAAAGPLAVEFIPRLYWPGLPVDEQRRVVRSFARDVIPLVRSTGR